MQTGRRAWLRSALWLEIASLVWVCVEATMTAVAAFRTGSISVSAFSIESAIELVTGITLWIRLRAEFKASFTADDPRTTRLWTMERAASAVVGSCLFLLAAYIAVRSGRALAAHSASEFTALGTAAAIISSVLTPWLARQKQFYGRCLRSRALLGDAACSLTCAYMAWVLLAGLVLERLFNWWWVDPAAAMGILYFVVREAWESVESARTGQWHHHDEAHRHEHRRISP